MSCPTGAGGFASGMTSASSSPSTTLRLPIAGDRAVQADAAFLDDLLQPGARNLAGQHGERLVEARARLLGGDAQDDAGRRVGPADAEAGAGRIRAFDDATLSYKAARAGEAGTACFGIGRGRSIGVNGSGSRLPLPERVSRRPRSAEQAELALLLLGRLRLLRARIVGRMRDREDHRRRTALARRGRRSCERGAGASATRASARASSDLGGLAPLAGTGAGGVSGTGAACGSGFGASHHDRRLAAPPEAWRRLDRRHRSRRGLRSAASNRRDRPARRPMRLARGCRSSPAAPSRRRHRAGPRSARPASS